MKHCLISDCIRIEWRPYLVGGENECGHAHKSLKLNQNGCFTRALTSENQSMFLPLHTQNHKASRSKFVAKDDVGSLWCVDRSRSLRVSSAAVSMNESRHSSAARQRFTSIGGASSSSDGALPQIASDWGPRRFSIGRGQTRAQSTGSSSEPTRVVPRSLVRRSQMPNASFKKSTINWPQGASPARVVTTAGEGPVLCFQPICFHRSF